MVTATTSSFAVIFLFIGYCTSSEDLTLTATQKQKLDKLRDAVENKISHDWLKEDISLLRYLKARGWNVRNAENMIMQTDRWLKEYKMDTIHDEDFSDYESEYPMYTDGVDNNGQPILAFSFGDWNVREAVVQGRMPKLIRWMNKNRDLVFKKSRENMKSGNPNATQWTFLADLDNFNQKQHLCGQCLQLYTEFVAVYDQYYPGSANKIVLINSPNVFETVLNLIRPMISQNFREALKVFGHNKAQWEPVVYENTKKDQLPPSFGGTGAEQE